MSAYNEFVAEKEKIDYLLELGYVIKGVNENLSGAVLEFEYFGEDGSNPKIEKLHILNAKTRKYFSNILIQQQKQNEN